MKPSAADLVPWKDPDDLLEVLHRMGKEPVRELRESIAGLLDHEDPDVREEALRVLVTRWKDRSFRGKAVGALQYDPDDAVRSAAAFAVASSSTDDDRDHDTRLLVEIVVDQKESLDVRGAAYDALLILHRNPRFPTKKRDFDPIQDIDWKWIDTLRETGP